MKVKNPLAEWYRKLPVNDQRALSWLMVFLIVAGGYWLLTYSYKYRINNLKILNEDRRLLYDLHANAKKIKAQQSSQKVEGRDQSLLTLASSTAKEQQITFKRFQPDGDSTLRLWMESVNFNNLLIWLHSLDKKNGVSVEEIAVDGTATEGIVNVRLTLVR